MRRIEAKALGLRFYTGKPCVQGHTGERYTSTGQCVECIRQRTAEQVKLGYFKALYWSDPVKYKAQAMRWQLKYPELARARIDDWKARNPEKRKAIAKSYKHRRRAIEKDGISTVNFQDWVESQAKICYWCETSCQESFHVDHFQPLSKGGKHEAANLVIACPTCNLRKSAKDPQDFALEIGREHLGIRNSGEVERHTFNPDMLT